MDDENLLKNFERLLREVDALYLVYRVNKDAKAPFIKRKELEKLYSRLRNESYNTSINSYKKNNLMQRFNMFVEKWEKLSDERELGVIRGTKAEYSVIKKKETHREPDRKEAVQEMQVQAKSREEKLKELYQSFKSANEKIGKSVAEFSKFKDYLSRLEQSIKTKTNAKAIDFIIKIEDGKPALKAKIKK